MRESSNRQRLDRRRQSGLSKACLYLLLVSGCATPNPSRVASTDTSYRVPPRLDDGWQVASPEELGLQREPLERLTEVLRSGAEYPNVHSLVIVKDGRLVYEEYFAGEDRRHGPDGQRQTVTVEFDRDTLHDIRSAGKSVTSALVGIALDSGAIPSLDLPVADYFPEHAERITPETRRITLGHALTMSAGFDWNEGEVPYTDPNNDSERMDADADPASFVLGRGVTTEPGTTWSYNSGLPVLLGLIVSRATGRPSR